MEPNTTDAWHLSDRELKELQFLGHRSTAQGFESAEDLIRRDASQIEPPDTILEHLNESIAKEQKNNQPCRVRFDLRC